MADFSGLSTAELRALLESEKSKRDALSQDLAKVETELQETGRANEREEEKMMNNFNKRIKQLRKENVSIAMRIQREEEYIKTTLTEKYNGVIKDKERLQDALAYQEGQVIEHLQLEIDRLNQEALSLEGKLRDGSAGQAIDVSQVDASLHRMLEESEKRKSDYEAELTEVRKEVERLITANSLLLQRVSAAQMELMVEQPTTAVYGETLSRLTDVGERVKPFSNVSPTLIAKRRRRLTHT